MMFGTENKAIQCDLRASSRNSEVTQILEYSGNTVDDIVTQTIPYDSAVRVFESVHCSDPPFAQDNEEVAGTKQEQNEQTVSNDGGQSNESVREEQQLPTDAVGGSKSSLSGDREVCFPFE